MATGKKQSKRQPLSRKYKIGQRAKEHERKLKKAAKKNPAMRKKLRKDLGIPNLNPFKQQILKRLEEQQKVIKFNELARQRRLQDAVSKRGRRGEHEAPKGKSGMAKKGAESKSRRNGTVPHFAPLFRSC